MSGARTYRAPVSEALWRALCAAGEDGLSATDAAARCVVSVVFARKTMRAWSHAGLADYIPAATAARADSGRYVLRPGVPGLPPIVHTDGRVAPREGAMAPSEFAAIRRRLGLSLTEMARRLGRTGLPPTLSRAMRRYEQGRTPIDAALAERVRGLLDR